MRRLIPDYPAQINARCGEGTMKPPSKGSVILWNIYIGHKIQYLVSLTAAHHIIGFFSSRWIYKSDLPVMQSGYNWQFEANICFSATRWGKAWNVKKVTSSKECQSSESDFGRINPNLEEERMWHFGRKLTIGDFLGGEIIEHRWQIWICTVWISKSSWPLNWTILDSDLA